MLADAGLVIGTPDGNRRVYELDQRGVQAGWQGGLTAFAQRMARPT